MNSPSARMKLSGALIETGRVMLSQLQQTSHSAECFLPPFSLYDVIIGGGNDVTNTIEVGKWSECETNRSSTVRMQLTAATHPKTSKD